MYWAASIGHNNIVRILCKNGAYASLSERRDYSTLSTPCSEGEYEIVKLLLSKGANPTKGDALHKAFVAYHHEIVEKLISHPKSDVNKVSTKI